MIMRPYAFPVSLAVYAGDDQDMDIVLLYEEEVHVKDLQLALDEAEVTIPQTDAVQGWLLAVPPGEHVLRIQASWAPMPNSTVPSEVASRFIRLPANKAKPITIPETETHYAVSIVRVDSKRGVTLQLAGRAPETFTWEEMRAAQTDRSREILRLAERALAIQQAKKAAKAKMAEAADVAEERQRRQSKGRWAVALTGWDQNGAYYAVGYDPSARLVGRYETRAAAVAAVKELERRGGYSQGDPDYEVREFEPADYLSEQEYQDGSDKLWWA
jgi:hypothetical protein